MKSFSTIITFLLLSLVANAQSWSSVEESKKGELKVFYYENEPYSYTAENGKLLGIEVDILNAFVDWVKEKEGVEIELTYHRFQDFNHFSQEIISAPTNAIGLGSVTITPEREKHMKFSAPYLKNVSVLVTDGYVPTVRGETELMEMVLALNPVTIKGSIHERYLKMLYEKITKEVKFTYEKEVSNIPLKMKEDTKFFGYIDIISFWKYVKSNKNHFIKMHKFANVDDERFGFVFSSKSDWQGVFNVFFENGFGFTATKKYHAILEKYLGKEIINRVEID